MTLQAGLPIAFTASRQVRAAIARIGRAEDARFSPSGKRLVVAGLETNRLLILDVEVTVAADQPRIALIGCVEAEAATFDMPHGAAWLDEDTLIVANRGGSLVIVALPKQRSAASRAVLEAVQVVGSDGKDLVKTPGSVLVVPVGLGLIEVFVCNNYVDHVTRHLVDQRNGYAVVASELLFDDGIAVPDGIAQSPSGQWIAVSNHQSHNVLVFRNDDQLNRTSKPQGVLTGMCFPHALIFSRDEDMLLVADAGAPVVHLFKSEDRGWSGPRTPCGALRVLSDAAFKHGNYNPSEGGPKGIDLTRDNRVMVTSCEAQPLAFFDMRGILPAGAPPVRRGDNVGETDRARDTMVRYLSAARTSAHQETEAIRRATRYERQDLILVKSSRSWRLTAPLRYLNMRAKKMKHHLLVAWKSD